MSSDQSSIDQQPSIDSADDPGSNTPEAPQQTALSLEQLAEALADAQEQIAKLNDELLRAQAEIQNIRRRAERDVESAHKFGLEKFVKELLPVADNFERALSSSELSQASDELLNSLRTGIEMNIKLFFDSLAKFHVVPIDPQGEPFDPQMHQAMAQAPRADVEPNTVITVMQKGFTLHGRLMRPAMVVVSKADQAS